MFGGVGRGRSFEALLGQKGKGIAAARAMGQPGSKDWHGEAKQLIALDQVDLLPGPLPVTVPEGVGKEKEANVGLESVTSFQRARGGQSQGPVAGGDGVAERLRRDMLIVGLGGEDRGERRARLFCRACRRGCPRVDIGRERRRFFRGGD